MHCLVCFPFENANIVAYMLKLINHNTYFCFQESIIFFRN